MKTKIQLFSISLLLFFPLLNYAQTFFRLDAKATTHIDNGMIECLYRHTNLARFKEPKHGEEEYEREIYNTILQANTFMSKFWDYNSFKKDSIIYSSAQALPIDSIRKLDMQYGANAKYLFTPVIFKNYPKDKITVTDEIFLYNYIYEENKPYIDWRLDDDTLTVCGYICNKANTSLGGREWIVWYTPDIAISDGPWKLSGLPGLILKAFDDSGAHSFEAIAIRQVENPIYINKDARQIKTQRDEFVRNKNLFEADPMKGLQEAENAIEAVTVLNKRLIVNNKYMRIGFNTTIHSPLELE